MLLDMPSTPYFLVFLGAPLRAGKAVLDPCLPEPTRVNSLLLALD